MRMFPTGVSLGPNQFSGLQTINSAAPAALLVGSPIVSFGQPSLAQFVSSTSNLGFGDGLTIGWADATASNRPALIFARSRGSLGTPADVAANDVLGSISYYARVSGSFVESATLRTDAVDTSGNAMLAYFARSGGTVAQRWSVASDGSLRTSFSTAIPAGGTAGLGYLFSSTANFGIFFGSGLPTLSAARGSLYVRSDGSSGSTRLYVNTDGGTTWTNFTSAA